jgi:uncharacterized membrane protein
VKKSSKFKQIENAVADRITGFAGSMLFVYLSTAMFFIWMLFIEKSPWPALTLVVSLEAIYLSTFVMISQNRSSQTAERRAKSDFDTNKRAEKQITELVDMIKSGHAKLNKNIQDSHDELGERISFINRPRLEKSDITGKKK